MPELATLYRKSIVAFIDLLGFRSIIQSQRASLALDALNHVRQLKSETDGLFRVDGELVRTSMFSDSIALSVPVGSEPHEAAYVINLHVQELYLSLLERGILCRGGICVGDIYHEDPVLFGPALVNAVKLETQAIYPRVMLHGEVCSLVDEYEKDEDEQDELPQGPIYKADKDGRRFLCMFNSSYWGTNLSGTAREVFHTPMDAVVTAMLVGERDERVIQKLTWLRADIEEDAKIFGGRLYGDATAPRR